MTTFLVPIIVFLSIGLVLLVLIQKPKGGGLSAGFQSANSALGVAKTTQTIEKLTWGIMGAIAILVIVCTVTTKYSVKENGSSLHQAEGTMTAPENVEDSAVELPAEAPAEAE